MSDTNFVAKKFNAEFTHIGWVTIEGANILRNACFYLFEMYGGPFDMQRDPGAAINIMFSLLAERVVF